MNQDHVVNPCPICGGSRQVCLFEIRDFSVTSCEGCRLTFSSRSIFQHVMDHLLIRIEEFESALPKGKTEIESAKNIPNACWRFNDIRNILLIADPDHCFAALAKDFGFE